LLASRSKTVCCGCGCGTTTPSHEERRSRCGTAIVVAGELYPRPEFHKMGCAAVHAAQSLFAQRCMPTNTILVQWRGKPSVSHSLVDEVITMDVPQCNRSAFYAPGGKHDMGKQYTPAFAAQMSHYECNVLNMLAAVSAGIDRASKLGSRFVFRVRVDMIVQQWAMPRDLAPSCFYGHMMPHGQLSDNVVFGPLEIMRQLYSTTLPDSSDPTSIGFMVERYLTLTINPLFARRVREAHAVPCFFPFRVHLIKPDNQLPGEPLLHSKGIKTWWTDQTNGSALLEAHLADQGQTHYFADSTLRGVSSYLTRIHAGREIVNEDHSSTATFTAAYSQFHWCTRSA